MRRGADIAESMTSTGLLERAARLRSKLSAPAILTGTNRDAGLDADLEKDSGITVEDRRDILAAIDTVARSNRISAGPEAFALKPRRKGLLFPLVVNLAAIILTSGAVFGLRTMSARKNAEVAETEAVVATAEGRLIQELKRESDSKLQEKDKAIADIQGRLTALDKERSDLAASIEEKVKVREAELRAELAVELERERARLIDQGLSESVIQERLKRFEAEKTAAFRRELDAFQRQAQAERDAAEERFSMLRNEYQSSIASLSEDRKRIQDESKRRESELRASMEAKTKELESQSAEARAGLERARTELARLEEERSQAEAVEDRIIGLYGSVRAALRDRRFEAAAEGAAALAAYLNEPSVAQAPSLQSRRDTDLFVADALASLAKAELSRTGADATKLLAQAELLAAARAASAAADKALRAGDAAAAQTKYREALERVPEILAAHEFFLGRLRDEESIRRARLSETLALAESAYRSGELAEASARYAEALAYLPVDDTARRDILARIGRSAIAAADTTRRDADTKSAREPLAAARRDLAAAKWTDSLTEFVSVLASYPAAEQASEAARGVSAALDGLERAATAKTDEDAMALAALRDEAARLKAESEKTIADLRVDHSRLVAEAGDKDARIGELEALLAAAQEKSAAAAAAAGAATPAATTAAGVGDIAALGAEVQRLGLVAAKYDRLSSSYVAYAAKEDAALAAAGPGALVAAQTSLDAFLDGPEARESMPGLRERIVRFERSFQEAGQREVLYNALDLVDGAIRARDSAARDRYFSDLETRYAGDSAMLDFLAGLRKSLR
jgi:hypothetical protein